MLNFNSGLCNANTCQIRGNISLRESLGLRNDQNDCYFNSVLHVFMGLNPFMDVEQWVITTLPELQEYGKCLDTLQRILVCRCSNRFNLVSSFKKQLSKYYSIFANNEQQDCLEAFNHICDVLDKATQIPLGIDNLYVSCIKDNFVGLMTTKSICNLCNNTSYSDTEYRELYISPNHSIEESLSLSYNFNRQQLCHTCNGDQLHNCQISFITNPTILVLVVKKFDNNM